MKKVQVICDVYCSVDESDPICKHHKNHNTQISCPFYPEAKNKYEKDDAKNITDKYYGDTE